MTLVCAVMLSHMEDTAFHGRKFILHPSYSQEPLKAFKEGSVLCFRKLIPGCWSGEDLTSDS